MGGPLQTSACSQPDAGSISAAFDLAGNNLLSASDPQFGSSGPVHNIPPTLLKAVGWVESGWRQFDATGKPLVAPDFGYGIMQITSGMPGAFGSVRGTIPPLSQSRVASDYVYNIAYGAKMLADKWSATPRIGNGDPSVIENWYFALWAYNGWGWVNNPNNPRFTRIGTPADNPGTFPYQERVLYLVQHPPHDSAGNPRWKPISVALPSTSTIGASPHSFTPTPTHAQPVPALSSIYTGSRSLTAMPGSIVTIPIKVENTGTLPWPSIGTLGISLTYHLMTQDGDPLAPITPFSKGVISFAQAQTSLPHDVLPGTSATIQMSVSVPTSTGSYKLVWDLQQGTSTLFSQQGVMPLTTQLRVVVASAPTFTPAPVHAPRVTQTENVQYVRDTSVPDGSTISSRTVFEKGWLLFNAGKVAWGPGWSVRHVSGNAFGFKTGSLPLTLSCQALNLVATLHTPKRSGSYTGTWRVYDPDNIAVGDRLTVVIDVQGPPGGPTPVPTSSPSPTAVTHAPATPTPTPVG